MPMQVKVYMVLLKSQWESLALRFRVENAFGSL